MKKMSKEIFRYLVFGVLTTLINIMLYNYLYYGIELGNVISNIFAWLAAVLFAFITNRLWVFESRNTSAVKEAVKFFCSRGITGALDIFIMFLTVDILLLPAGIMKVVTNAVVVILNYLFSKLWIFNKRD